MSNDLLQAVNSTMVQTYWKIGRQIVENRCQHLLVQQGKT